MHETNRLSIPSDSTDSDRTLTKTDATSLGLASEIFHRLQDNIEDALKDKMNTIRNEHNAEIDELSEQLRLAKLHYIASKRLAYEKDGTINELTRELKVATAATEEERKHREMKITRSGWTESIIGAAIGAATAAFTLMVVSRGRSDDE